MPEDPQTTGEIKKWEDIKIIHVRCKHKVISFGKDKTTGSDDLEIAAKEDDCEIEIEHKDGKKQTHKVKKGGGFGKYGDYVLVWVDPIFKID